MVHIKYRNTNPLADIVFPTDFYFEMYVDTIIQRPSYPIEEETRQDQVGDTHRLFQRWNKEHQVSFKAIESLCDAVSLLPLMDYVYVNNTRVYDVFVDIQWDESIECLADVVITFSYKKTIKTLS